MQLYLRRTLVLKLFYWTVLKYRFKQKLQNTIKMTKYLAYGKAFINAHN